MSLKCWLLLLLSLSILNSYAQKTHGYVGYAKYPETDLPVILTKLKTANEDTTKVNLLIEISSIYCEKDPSGPTVADSALYYGNMALALSKSLHDGPGIIESSFIVCKRFIQNNDVKDAQEIIKAVYGEEQVRLLIVMAEHYTFLPGTQTANLDLAYPYIKRAIDVSSAIHSVYWRDQSLNILGKYYFTRGEFTPGKNAYLQIINYYKKTGDKLTEADWWNELYHYMPDNDSTYAEEIRCATNAMNIYKQYHKVKDLAYIMDDMATTNSFHNNFDLSIDLESKAIQLLKSDHVVKLFKQYARLSDYYLSKGNFNKALYCALESQKSAELLKQPLGLNYQLIADIYRQMGDPLNSIKYYKLCLASNETIVNAHNTFMMVRYIVQGLIETGQPAQGLAFIKGFINKYPPVKLSDQEIVASVFGDCYNALRNFKLAEKYYLDMIRLHALTQKDKIREIFVSAEISSPEAYYIISKFYTDQKRFKESVPYIKQVLSSSLSPIMLKNAKIIASKIDSASGNYQAALVDFKRATKLKDSLFTAAQNTELTMLKVQFNTEQKEKNIQLLEKEAQLQKKKIEQAEQRKQFSYGIFVLLGIVIITLYSRYYNNQKSNRLLKAQKQEIDEQYHSLQAMNQKQKVLLTEKEWLMRELHHRVKNNMQIIMGLLSSQAAYLKDDIAIKTVTESQHRIQAMSLIHQKLYKTNNVTNIYMPEYIYELVDYLKESFKTERCIYFGLQIDHIFLDVLQAVPVGLILNEVITNAIKYAFPYSEEDKITIRLALLDTRDVHLVIGDNGRGLPDNFNISESNTFGMILIKGLTEDLGGKCTIISDKGTVVNIVFPCMNIIQKNTTIS
jgi:two-component sensor histidine kinase